MSKETLKTLRIIIPGVIILLFGISIFRPHINSEEILSTLTLLEGGTYLILVIFWGSIYYIMDLRKFSSEKPLEKIRNNIKGRLLESFTQTAKIYNHKEQLMGGKALMECFYGLIDHNETLKEKAKNVHLTGLILSSVSDVITISVLAGLLHFIIWLISTANIHLVWSFVFGCVYILFSKFILSLATKRHIEKSDEQLD